MRVARGPLTLALTRRCDLRCGWCPQEFSDRDMDERVLDAALERLAGGRTVKLFGGEPLLTPGLVRRAIERLGPRARVELPTNGSRLDAGMAEFLRAHPNVVVALSRPTDFLSELPNVVVNFLLTPGERAAAALRRFGSWLRLGARRFNVLPAYYVAWAPDELRELSRLLVALTAVFRNGITLVNRGRTGSAPLYNDGWCVDTDGSVYAGNFVLAAASAHRRRDFLVGSVLEDRPLRRVRARELWRDCFPRDAVRSTLAVDRLLTEFVHAL